MGVSHHTIKHGTSGRSILVFVRDGETGTGVTGLRHDSAGASAAFVRAGEHARPVALSAAAPDGPHLPGGLVEVDPHLLPGVYRFDLPDEMLAEGSTQAILMLRSPGGAADPVEVALVAYDPQDSWCMGVEGLANRRRHEFLRRALPRLTEMELALGEPAERELSTRMTEGGGDR